MSTLRSARDLRPLTEPGAAMYLRRVGDVLEVRSGRSVRRVPLTGPDRARTLATFRYHHVGSRGAGYDRFGLAVLGDGGAARAALCGVMSPMWDEAEVHRFAYRWGLATRTHHFASEEAFTREYPKLSKVTVGGGGMAGGCLFTLLVLVAVLGGAFGGIAGLGRLAAVLGIAGRPGMNAVTTIGGIVVGGAGVLFLGFLAYDLGRRVVRAVRAVRSRDGALRPTPRHGAVRVAVEDGELIVYGTQGRRLVFAPQATLLAPAPGALLFTDRARTAEVLLCCPFDPGEVADFAGRNGLAAPVPVDGPTLERLAGRLDGRRRIEPGEPAGFFTVTVGATVLGGIAYVPVMAGLVLLLGLVLPRSVTGFLAVIIMIVPLPALGPLTFRWIAGRDGRRKRRKA